MIDRFRRLETKPSAQSVLAANDTPIRVSGESDLPFVLEERCIWTPVLISEDIEEIMLGADWLETHNCVWNFRTKSLTIDGLDTVTLRRRGHFKCRWVLVRECQEIPPLSEKEVMARVTLLSTHESSGDAIIDAKKFRPGLYLSLIHI